MRITELACANLRKNINNNSIKKVLIDSAEFAILNSISKGD